MRYLFAKLLVLVLLLVSFNVALEVFFNKYLENSNLIKGLISLAAILIMGLFCSKIYNINIYDSGSCNIRMQLNYILIALGLVLFSFTIFLPLNLDTFLQLNKHRELKSTAIFLSLTLFPIAEEFLFRGVFCQILMKKYNLKKVVLYSGLLFSIVHLFTSTGLLPSFLIGVFLGYVYIHTRNLFVVIGFHIGINLLNLGLSQLFIYVWKIIYRTNWLPELSYVLIIALSIFFIYKGVINSVNFLRQ